MSTEQLPHNREMEEAVIASMLIDPDAPFLALEEGLTPEDFYDRRLGETYRVMLGLIQGGEPCSFLSVTDALEREKGSNGHHEYLTGIVARLETSIYVSSYARAIIRYARRRKVILAAQEIAAFAYSHDVPIEDILSFSSERIFSAAGESGDEAHLYGGDNALVEYIAEQQRTAEALAAGRDLIRTYWADIDRLTGNMQPGQLWVIGGNTSVGKTMALEQIAEANAKRGYKVVFYHFEISHMGMMHRAVARYSGIPSDQLRRGYAGPEVLSALDEMRKWFGNITLVHSVGWTAERVAADIMRMHNLGKCDLAIVDYLQKITLADRRDFSAYKLTSLACETLKSCAERVGIPVVLGSQTNREYKHAANRRPTSADLRDSGEIEEKANVVMMLHNPIPIEERDERAKTEIIEAYIEKNTDGPVGKARLVHVRGRYLLGDLLDQGGTGDAIDFD